MAWVPRASEVDGTRASAAPQDGQTGHLRILHLEDDTADSELIGSLLRTAGLDCELERVDTRAAFEASLASGAFQIILSDYSLPGFDGQAALGLARSLKPELPFLFVSGTIGEELAIESLKEGATDFVLKDRLQRLAPAVWRALAEAEERAFRQRSEAERERLLADLEVKNAELELFTYAVSHDLKSPLITIRGFADQARTAVGQGDRERALADLERIANASALMQRLLHELLDLSRIGRVVNPPQTLSLRELAEQAMALARGRLDGMAVELAPELPEVRGDPARLLQVLQNLLENAGQFRGEQEPPRVEVGMRRDGAARVFYVRDNGIGIEPHHHERVFGLFHKLDPRSPGSGIGLALARRIVEAHGGRLWVESDGKRQGATFCFTLPGA